MQLLVIRHALPLRSEPGEGSDPELSEDGIEQAKRLPDALARFPITRMVSSPQRRAIQTAQPVADALGLTVDIDDRLAEYDRDLAHYTPIEEASQEDLQRLIDGQPARRGGRGRLHRRVKAGVEDIVDAAAHEDTVALFSHGGVINALVHDIMKTARLLVRPGRLRGRSPDCCRRATEAGGRGDQPVEHVWDLLSAKPAVVDKSRDSDRTNGAASTLDGLDLGALDEHLEVDRHPADR